MSRDIFDLCAPLQPLARRFLAECHAVEIDAFLSETYRDEEDQNADYAKGRTVPGEIITNAQYGESPHNCTLPDGTAAARAFDFAIRNLDGTLNWDPKTWQWQKAIAIGQALGLVSGSTFKRLKDYPHMELPNWKTVVIASLPTGVDRNSIKEQS